MRRLSLPLLVAVWLVVPSSSFGQAPPPPPGVPGVRPGTPTPTGAQVPGMPPRDNAAAIPQTGTAVIRGRVIAAQTGQPLRRTQIMLVSSATAAGLRRTTTTDAEGRYQFAELPAGSFTITASKTGYVNLQYGQRRPFEDGKPVVTADNQTVDQIDFSLPRGGVIVVRLTDDFGEPLSGAQVLVQRHRYQPDGSRQLITAASGGSGIGGSGTDDRGELRLYGLMPGEYVLSATLRPIAPAGANANDSIEGFATTFYPGVIGAAQAVPVSVNIGTETAVQFSMAAAKLARVSGIVVDSEGRPAAGVGLSLVQRTATSMSSRGAGTAGPDGSFTIAAVPPGDYAIEVRARTTVPGAAPAAAAREAASYPVAVGGADITGVRITTSPGARISGRVVFEGTSPRENPGLTAIQRVTATPTDSGRQVGFLPATDPQANGTLDAEGRFQIAGASGLVFFNVNGVSPAWTLKSVVADGQNITDTPLDLSARTSISELVVTMTDKLASVSGQVGDGRGQMLRDYVVVIQPAEDKDPVVAGRLVRTVRPNNDGRFETRGLRPGRYIATAIEALEQGRQYAPEYQRELRRGAREFTVTEGQTVTLDLRLTPEL